MAGTRLTLALLLLALGCCLLAPATAQSPVTDKPAEAQAPAVPAELVIARFPMGTAVEGDALLVPVQAQGRTYTFMLDTGASNNVMEKALLTAPPQRVKVIKTTRGEANCELYAPVPATLGGLRLDSGEPYFGMDMTMLRKVSGHPLQGIVGMDFLRHFVVQLDYDRAEVLLLK